MSQSRHRPQYEGHGSTGSSSRRRQSDPHAQKPAPTAQYRKAKSPRDVARDWPELGEPNFNPVELSLALLDTSSLGKDRHHFQAAVTKLETVVDAIVSSHHKEFNATIDAYSGTLDGVNAAQQKAREMRDKLLKSRDQLRLRRADLVNHWVKARQYQEMIALLDHIDRIKATPAKLESLARKKLYPDAVKCVLDAILLASNESLGEIGALSELRRRLLQQKGAIYETVIDDIQALLYLRSTSPNGTPFALAGEEEEEEEGQGDAPIKLFDWKPQQISDPLRWKGEDGAIKGSAPPDASGTASGSGTGSSSGGSAEDGVAGGEEGSDITLDPPLFMGQLIHSLAQLDRLIEGLETLQQRIPNELHRLADMAVAAAAKAGEEPLRLLRSLSARFIKVLEAHWLLHEKVLLVAEAADPALAHRLEEVGQRTFKEAWLGVQGEVKSIFYDYLGAAPDGKEGGSTGKGFGTGGAASFANPIMSIEEVLRDKRRLRDKKKKLFRLGGKEGNEDVAASYGEVLSRLEDALPPPEKKKDALLKTPATGEGIDSSGGVGPIDPYATDGGGMDRRGHALLAKPEPAVVATLFRPALEFLLRAHRISGAVEIRDLLAFLEDYYTTFFLPRCSPQMLLEQGGPTGMRLMIKEVVGISIEGPEQPGVEEIK